MPQLSLKCPHCRAEKIGFVPKSVQALKPGIAQSLMFMQCEGCGHGLVLVLNNGAQHVQAWANGGSTSPGTIINQYPASTVLACPPDVPPPASSAYLSGMDNLGRTGGANAAAIMFRRSIEVAIKIVNPDGPKGDNLKKRIAALPESVATPAMRDWADHIRLDANDAAHEIEDFSEEDAKKLHIFAEMFLTYAFTLPAMLKRAQGIES